MMKNFIKQKIFHNKSVIKNTGYCPCCDKKVIFFSDNEWLRDHYRCSNCGCIPRNRALMHCIEEFYPNWRDVVIHESSPYWSGSEKLSKGAKQYITSQYYPDRPSGTVVNGALNINLEWIFYSG
jgi:hypothetical protein